MACRRRLPHASQPSRLARAGEGGRGERRRAPHRRPPRAAVRAIAATAPGWSDWRNGTRSARARFRAKRRSALDASSRYAIPARRAPRAGRHAASRAGGRPPGRDRARSRPGRPGRFHAQGEEHGLGLVVERVRRHRQRPGRGGVQELLEVRIAGRAAGILEAVAALTGEGGDIGPADVDRKSQAAAGRPRSAHRRGVGRRAWSRCATCRRQPVTRAARSEVQERHGVGPPETASTTGTPIGAHNGRGRRPRHGCTKRRMCQASRSRPRRARQPARRRGAPGGACE